MGPLPMKPTVVMPMANPGRAPGIPGCRFLALDYQGIRKHAGIMKMINAINATAATQIPPRRLRRKNVESN
jgi:hypothetical protein